MIFVPVWSVKPVGFMSRERHAAREVLAVDLPVALDGRLEALRERVHDRHADAVEAARDLVALAAELAAGVELRQDDRQRRQAVGAVRSDVDRDAAAAVLRP